MKKFIVITTINQLTQASTEFAKSADWKVILVGDKKTPNINSSSDNILFLDLTEQLKLGYKLVEVTPFNHYCRKNIGYVYAIKNKAVEIFDTDDDNIPYSNDWYKEFLITKNSQEVVVAPEFVNIYSLFSDQKVWPRGYPLNKINNNEITVKKLENYDVPIIQGLADKDPDIDAIHRLLFNQEIYFNKREPIVLDTNIYCPFNSQNTLWKSAAFPYLYLPISVNFRFTDILRSYIAQKGIWALKKNLAFVNATVYQERNQHNLLKDFEDEISCYLSVEKVVNVLNELKLTGNSFEDIKTMYECLLQNKIVETLELESLSAWIEDIKPCLQK